LHIKVLWSNEALDGYVKNPVVFKTKEWASVSCDLVNLITQIRTHRYLGDVSS